MSENGSLNIAVLIKYVPDMNAARIDRATGRVITGAQMGISSYDRYGIEAALRLKEAYGGDILVVCAGPAAAKDGISRALAMGADRGLLLELAQPNALDTLAIAEELAGALQGQPWDLVIAGQVSDDLEDGQVGAQVAELLGMPVVSNVVSIEREDDRLVVKRDMEDGYQIVRAQLPVVLLSSTGLDEPRVASVKGIMAAKKKPLEIVAKHPEPGERLTWDEPLVPPRTAGGVIVQDVPSAEAAAQLVAWLQEQKLV